MIILLDMSEYVDFDWVNEFEGLKWLLYSRIPKTQTYRLIMSLIILCSYKIKQNTGFPDKMHETYWMENIVQNKLN